MKFEKIHVRDVIAIITLGVVFYLFTQGYDSWLQGIAAVVIGYYFSKRVFEENNTTK
jgi:hypothetical protein